MKTEIIDGFIIKVTSETEKEKKLLDKLSDFELKLKETHGVDNDKNISLEFYE